VSIREDGRAGESWARTWLQAQGEEVFQVDWIARKVIDGEPRYLLVEVKNQECFEPPPFYGHGLPLWQVKARLRFQEETGIRAVLLVREKGTDAVHWQWLDVLERGEFFDTKGTNPRRVYPLTAFREAAA
jgi:hypothetical protein